jgi:immunomodulating metalloprotease
LELRSDSFSGYMRPQFTRSHRILLPPGQTVTITAPYGGPIYIQLYDRVGNANNGRYSARLRFDGVAKHAALLDMGDNSTMASFITQLRTNKLPAVDMRAGEMC